ncbi:serine/threonine-protein kinase [Streptomyces sp. NPDC005722]
MPPVRRPGTDPEAEHPEYAGQYRLEGRLGSGGMGVVHLSRSTSGMRLAVKVVHEEFAKDPEFRARFRQEVAAARRVSGAFTAPVVDADPDAERPWMATLYIPGPTLAEFVKRNGPVAPAQVRYLMAGLAEALRDIHRAGVVHRDLKPSNVLLAADGPKVIDFGISRPSDSDLRTETGKLIGTPPFMAPEQFKRPREVGPAADVFAMGSVLVHAATGRSPFDSDSPYIVAYQVVHDEPQLDGIPADLQPFIERCLAKDPDDRPTPDALMDALRSVSASYDTQAFAAIDTEIPLVEGLIPQPRQPQDESRAGAAPEPRSDARATPRARWRNRRLVAAVSTACAALATATVLAVAHLGGAHPATEPVGSGDTPDPATFRPWVTELRTDADAPQPGPASCVHADHALFCTQAGITAAKVDADGGLLQWSGRVERTAGRYPLAPVLAGGVLRTVSTDLSRMDGLRPSDGRPQWTLDLSAYAHGFYEAGSTVLLVGAGGNVTAIDGTSGRQRWRKQLPGHSGPSFAEYGGTGPAFAFEVTGDARHTQVSAVDLEDGTVRYQDRLDGELLPVAASGSTVVLASLDDFRRTRALVLFDTADRSTRRVPLVVPLVGMQAVLHDGTVYLLEYGGALLAVDTRQTARAEKAQRWRVETSVTNGSRPVIDGDRLYFSSVDGRLLAFDTGDGTLLGQTEPRPGPGSGPPGAPPAPVVADGKVFATAPDGSVFAVDAKDPSRW